MSALDGDDVRERPLQREPLLDDPDFASDKAKFPLEVEAVDCKNGNSKPIKFFFAKG